MSYVTPSLSSVLPSPVALSNPSSHSCPATARGFIASFDWISLFSHPDISISPSETYNALTPLIPSPKLFPLPSPSPLVTMLPPPIRSQCISSLPTSTLYQILQPIIVPASDPHARFYNWSKTFTCLPLITFEPSNVEECRLIFELARREDRTVRIVGSGLSPSDVGCTTEFMLRTHRMNKIRAVRG
jgi:hypothetical protein